MDKSITDKSVGQIESEDKGMQCHAKENSVMEFFGRSIGPEEIENIRWVRSTFKELSLSEFAGTVCEVIGWTTAGGNAKVEQCKEMLRALEGKGLIVLPKARTWSVGREPKMVYETTGVDTTEVTGCSEVILETVRGSDALRRWRSYVSKYHRLGDNGAYGAQVRYFIKDGERELGCLRFSASARTLGDRDKWIGWTNAQREARLQLVINNSRLLVLPWVKVKNLASHVLSMAAKRVCADWYDSYGYEPVLLETFVDTEYHSGTCYKAASWECIGGTKGRGRKGRLKPGTLSRKLIFVRPLRRDFRAILKGEKPFRGVPRHG